MVETPSNLPGIEIAPGVRALESELKFSFSRAGGPGGQNVNKLNTQAELRVRPHALIGLHPCALERMLEQNANKLTADGDVQIISRSERTQERNRSECMGKLREMIVAAQVVPKTRRKTRPSRSSKEKRLETKRQRSEIKKGRSQKFN